MLKTGLPVTVELFQWISSYGVIIKDSFDRTHNDYQILNSFIMSGQSLDDLDESDQLIVINFFRWFFCLCSIFDGGLFTSNIQSVGCYDDHLRLVWQTGISHKISLKTWDRDTRKAMDYIVFSACSIMDATDHLSTSLKPLILYLSYYEEQLINILDNANRLSLLKDGSFSDSFEQDPAFVFLLLSSFPQQLLVRFYQKFSDLFSDDLVLEVEHVQLPIKSFFMRSSDDPVVLIDKVKMHYNVSLCSSIDGGVKSQMDRYTHEFLMSHINDSNVKNCVIDQLNQVCNEQLQPRLDLLQMVIRHYDWPV